MSGETERNISGWTTDTLREHVLALINSNDKRYQQRFDAQEAANKYAQEKANEFRQSLNDIGSRQMPRTEAEALAKTNSEKIDQLQARMDRNEGRGGGFAAGWGYLVGAVGLIAVLIAIFIAVRGG